jgi:ankyrin repeat protein
VARALIEAKADLGKLDTTGSNALHWAASNGHAEVLEGTFFEGGGGTYQHMTGPFLECRQRGGRRAGL